MIHFLKKRCNVDFLRVILAVENGYFELCAYICD
jgi:hypothetical protein